MKKWGKFILLFLTLATLVFIFSNSLRTASVSNEQSGRITSLFSEIYRFITGKLVPPARLTHTVRKVAHFVEFALLGFLGVSSAASFFGELRGRVYMLLFWGLVAALLDEYLQRFSRGRSPQVSDIFLDFTGYLSGFALACLITFLLKRRRSKHGVGVSLD